MGTNAAFVTDPAHGGLSLLRTEWMHLTQGAGRDTSGVAGKWRNVIAKVIFAGAASIASAASMVSAGEPADAILKIYATQLVSDYGAPWRSAASRTVSGSGFVVTGRRILTNAHVVSDATFIQVRRHGESERFAARVLHVSHDADLAILTVDEPGFFDSLTPLSLGGLPELREEVLVLGFPVGGDTLSVTRGVVSRIEHQVYVHNRAELLAGQIDGAVNPGNSGGPVLAQGKVVGVAMQTAVGADNVAYMIPIPVLDHFLADVADGRYDGVPAIAFRWQRLEAADLRRRYALPPSRTGVLVLETMVGSAAAESSGRETSCCRSTAGPSAPTAPSSSGRASAPLRASCSRSDSSATGSTWNSCATAGSSATSCSWTVPTGRVASSAGLSTASGRGTTSSGVSRFVP